MKKIVILLSLITLTGLIQAMEAPKPISEQSKPSLPPDIKKIILGTLVYSGESLDEAVKNVKAYLWTHPTIIALLDQRIFNNLIEALGDRWESGNYFRVIDSFRKSQPFETATKQRIKERLDSFIDGFAWGERALIIAYRSKNIEDLSRLIQEGIPYTLLAEFLPIYAWYAMSEGHDKVLMAAGADKQKLNKLLETRKLFLAIREQNLDKVHALIQGNVNLNVVNVNGQTPLMVAAALNNNPDLLRALVKAGANINAQDPNGRTALNYAITAKLTPNLETLVALGANINIPDTQGITGFQELDSYGRKKGYMEHA